MTPVIHMEGTLGMIGSLCLSGGCSVLTDLGGGTRSLSWWYFHLRRLGEDWHNILGVEETNIRMDTLNRGPEVARHRPASI